MPVLTLSPMVVRTRTLLLPLLISVFSLTGCSLSNLVGDSAVPPGTTDPATIETSQGALGMYYGALQLLNEIGNEFVFVSGYFSDELRPSMISSTIGAEPANVLLDSRYVPEGQTSQGQVEFGKLHSLRNHARQSRGALFAYAPTVSRAVVGHTYAVEGVAEVLLADLYCSGVQLNTVDFDGDFTINPGSTTEEIYRHAIVLFDSAIALSDDSLRLKDFARMGKARALMALGDYAAAQQASADVDTEFKYELTYAPISGTGTIFFLPNSFAIGPSAPRGTGWIGYTVSDGEGVDSIRGIRYASRNDPRAPVKKERDGGALGPYPAYTVDTTKYKTNGTSPIVIASGIEARLIQAEAELAQGSSQWLVTLNALRTTCTTAAACPSPAPAGSGKIQGLPPLVDPGDPRERVALLFEERAFWLFLTGHRQGDMRRLIREYGWELDEVYPTGPYYRRNARGVYGDFVNLPIPRDEGINNPKYEGCSHRRA